MKRTLYVIPELAVVLLLFTIVHTVYAQADPPDRVARLNFIQGVVSYLPSGGDQNDWVSAMLNRPLTTGDRLWADANSRSEMHIGPNAIRIDSMTGISFLNLDDTSVQIRLTDGSMIVRLRRLDPGNTFEIDTPSLAFPIRRPGDYRIDTHPDRNVTVITVREGESEAVGGGRSWQILSDQQAIFTGTDELDYDLRDADAQPISEFDQWARKRDEREDHVFSAQYVSPEMTGYEDLDSYGTWTQVPEYGWCWAPTRVAADWAPYRFGHWVWIAPWGWTWVDDEPWGFAPFHYGRWAYRQAGWIWVPGPIRVRPIYAPALVAWVGGSGFGVAVSAGRGGIGWFPLGPREVFVPPYRVSQRYVTQVNVTNTVVNRTTVINVYENRSARNLTYVNRAAPNAVSVVSRDTFVTSRPVGRNTISVPSRELAGAPVGREIEFAPERASVYGPGSRNAPHPPAQAMGRPVVTTRNPAPEPRYFPPAEPARADRPAGRARNPVRNPSPPSRPDPVAERPQQAPAQVTRPAPQVRPPTPAEQANRQAKQKAWENAHPRNKEGRNRTVEPNRNRPPHRD
jgi:hypothetical protein